MTVQKITHKTYFLVLIIIASIFMGLRFINLEADFPSGLTPSRVLYSDEGWYANGAINYWLGGRWYIQGDFNPMINMPLGHLIQAGTFSLLGMSLFSARLTVVLFSLLLIGATYFFVRQYTDRESSLLIVVLLSTNFVFFAYSRLAILELIMVSFIMMALSIASSTLVKNSLLSTLISSVILALAVLTKSTAIFALPLLIYLSGLKGENYKKRILLSFISASVFFIIFIIYNVAASSAFPEDFSYFRKINLGDRLVHSPLDLAKNVLRVFMKARLVAPIAYVSSMFLSLLLICVSGEFRENILVRLTFIWIILYFSLLSLVIYHPPRYYIPLIIPLIILFSIAIRSLHHLFNNSITLIIQLTLIVSVLVFNSSQILTYMYTPSFSFINMAREVKSYVSNDHKNNEDIFLIGNFANSISLATGIPSINSNLGTRPLQWRLNKFRPDYYITLGDEADIVKALNKDYECKKIAQWDVLNNYYRGKKVHLFKLLRKK
jgi:4-amino-4-deoxy-L-arabinose transferase-like glycosyltransferase